MKPKSDMILVCCVAAIILFLIFGSLRLILGYWIWQDNPSITEDRKEMQEANAQLAQTMEDLARFEKKCIVAGGVATTAGCLKKSAFVKID